MSQQAQVVKQAQQKTLAESSPKASVLQRAAVTSTITPVHSGILQRCSGGVECAACREKREHGEMMMQRAAVNSAPVNAVPPIVHEVLSSPGQLLDAGTRAFMEPRFGYDFSQVRVHTDARAAESARAVNALAYTVGRDVAFGARQFEPGTSDGRRLLAHELAHVVQQGSNLSLQSQAVSSPSDSSEQEASLTAEAILAEKPLPSLSSSNLLMQRQVAAASFSGLTATRVAFKNSGGLDPDNCATSPGPASLGAGVGGGAINAMEMTYHINGPIPAGTEFDITRTVTDTEWESDAAGTWSRKLHTPAGTLDDTHDADECLIPNKRRIFVKDSPGFGGLDPRGISWPGGYTVSATATGFVIKLSFAEWVIARNRPLGIGWTRISTPTFTHWHSITSVALVGGVWSLVDTPSGQKNEIKLGSISTAGAAP